VGQFDPVTDQADRPKRKGVRASKLIAAATGAEPGDLQRRLVKLSEQARRDGDHTFFAQLRAEADREALQAQAQTANVETASRLAAVEQELKAGSKLQRQALWVGAVAAVAAVLAAVASVLVALT
jgi:hypothetical protein